MRSNYNQRKWKVRGLARAGAYQTSFVVDAGLPTEHTTTVAEFFLRAHGIPLRFPHLPCLLVGREGSPVELPMELCTFLPGQKQSQLSNEQKAAMIKDTCSDPDSRFHMVQDHVLQSCKDPVSASFGLHSDPAGLMRINARVLEPLQLTYRDPQGGEATIRPDGVRGRWNMRTNGVECHMARSCARVEH